MFVGVTTSELLKKNLFQQLIYNSELKRLGVENRNMYFYLSLFIIDFPLRKLWNGMYKYYTNQAKCILWYYMAVIETYQNIWQECHRVKCCLMQNRDTIIKLWHNEKSNAHYYIFMCSILYTANKKSHPTVRGGILELSPFR